jgi:hypothetical protein
VRSAPAAEERLFPSIDQHFTTEHLKERRERAWDAM